jgi:hypothetical protein
MSLFGKPNRFDGIERGDTCYHWRFAVQGPPRLFQKLKFLFTGQRRRFPERAQGDNSVAATLDQPPSLGSKCFVVDRQISLEGGCDGWKYSSPIFLVQFSFSFLHHKRLRRMSFI